MLCVHFSEFDSANTLHDLIINSRCILEASFDKGKFAIITLRVIVAQSSAYVWQSHWSSSSPPFAYGSEGVGERGEGP